MFVGNALKAIFRNFCRKSHNFTKIDTAKTHYEVLGLSADCSAKDIKDAYIKLSKEYHPDINTKQGAHKRFVQIVEAYNTLSKTKSRQFYDGQLRNNFPGGDVEETTYQYYRGKTTGYAYDDPQFWMNRKKYYQDDYSDNTWYYGVPGLHRVSNGFIALICIIFTSIGVTIQFLAVRHSVTLKRDRIKRESEENEELLANLRDNAERNSKEHQINEMEKRLKNNPFFKPYEPKE